MNGAMAKRPAGEGPARGKTILIAEDHDFQCRALALLLRSLGAARVLEAADGTEALALFDAADCGVDLIICDLDMPRMDGMELMRHLGSRQCDVGVIITSAHESNVINSVQIMAHAYGLRLLGVIEKPATRESVGRLIELDAAELKLRETQSIAVASPCSIDDIQAGIAADQFEPFFQPKADLSSGRIVGAEALARWLHPERGIIPPAAFIGPLESAGRLDDLTFRMLERSAAACRGWREAGFDLGVSVNLSLVSLTSTDLADRITDTVVGAGLEPARMTLEITESAAMTDVATALENLARLRLRGFGLAIDDFGTGFSSIQQLARIAFTELKIDRSFVSRLQDKNESRVIVETSIDMARRLGIQSVAEGIESQAEWNLLADAGCCIGQGYFISRAVDDEQFIALCRRARQ